MAGIPITTPDAIVEAFATLIEAITPGYMPSIEWRRMESDAPRDVTQPRAFALSRSIAEPSIPGMWGGDGMEKQFELGITVGYQGFDDPEALRMADEDARQLDLLFLSALDGTVPGLHGYGGERLRAQPTKDDRAQLIVDYILEVHYESKDL